MSKALDIIRTEHRSIATVLENLRRLARGSGGVAAFNSAVFGAMVNYLQDFADRVHHPKEDRYLFAPLRRRGAPAEDLIAELEREHIEGWRTLLGLRRGYARLSEAGDAGLPEFARAVEDFAEAYFEHMRKEEEELFPLALKLFTSEEWDAIDRAFAEHRDPGPPEVTPRLHEPC
jgi:hemerythrin-like domain-containing protein